MAKSKSVTTPLVEEAVAPIETTSTAVSIDNHDGDIQLTTPLVEEAVADLQLPSFVISAEASVLLDTLQNIVSESVNVVIKYPETWNKERFMKDGDIKTVSKQTAKTFIEIGIATLVTE